MTPDTFTMDARQRAADALMQELEDWAKGLGEAGVTRSDGARYFPSRQVDRLMRRAHADGRLLEALTEWLPSYRGLRTSKSGEAYANRMREIVEHGCQLWEAVVAQDARPWSEYIKPEQRQMLLRIVDDVDREIERGQRLRASMAAQLKRHDVRPALNGDRAGPG